MIRPATPDDLEAILRLERESFPTDAWSEAMMREELASPHGHYVVLERAGRLVGYAGLRAPAGARDGDVQTIAVAASERGHGRGRMLLRTLIAAALDRGVREVFLEVRADNPVAQRLYASEGFLEIGRRPRYYQPDDVDALVMKVDVAAWAAASAAAVASAPASASQNHTPVAGFRENPATPVRSCDADACGADARGAGEDAAPGAATTAGRGWC